MQRLPFYAFARLLLLSYLVLPQTQGARLLYQSHIDPFISAHESDIDKFITRTHDRVKAIGLSSLKRFVDFIKENILGLQPADAPSYSSPKSGSSYAQTLLSRFNLPSARQNFANPAAGDFYNLLGAALGQVGVTGRPEAREAHANKVISQSGSFIPQGMTSTAEKMTFLETQRERLKLLLTALDREASEISNEEKIEKDVEKRLEMLSPQDNGLRKSRSEAEFEAIDKTEASSEPDGKREKGTKASWIPWGWFGGQQNAKPTEDEKGISSAVDLSPQGK